MYIWLVLPEDICDCVYLPALFHVLYLTLRLSNVSRVFDDELVYRGLG